MDDILTAAQQLGLEVKGLRFNPCPHCGAAERRGACYTRQGIRYSCPHCGEGGDARDLARACGRAPDLTVRIKERPPERPNMSLEQVQGWLEMWARQELGLVHWWLRERRGLDPRLIPKGDVLALTAHTPTPRKRPDITAARNATPCAVFPLRTLEGALGGAMVRPCLPERMGEPWKARLLNSGPGADRDGDRPLCYGHPEWMSRAEVVVLTEGALDTLTAQLLSLKTPIIAVGAICAGHMATLWPTVLHQMPCRVIVVYHKDKPDRHGREAGPAAAHRLQELCPNVELFPWPAHWPGKDLNDAVLGLGFERVRREWKGAIYA